MMSNHGPNLQTSSMSVFSICPLPQFPSNGLRGGSSPHSVSVGRTKLFRERFSRLCFLPHKSHHSVRLQFTGNVIKYFSCFCPRLSMTITMWHTLQVQTESPAVHQSCRRRFARGVTFIWGARRGLGVADAHNWQNQLVHGRHWSGGIEHIPTSAHRAGTGGGRRGGVGSQGGRIA